MKALTLAAAIAALISLLAAAGCTKEKRDEATTKAKEMYSDTKAALSNAWADVKAYTFDKKDQFTATARNLTSKMDAQAAELRADYAEERASASRKAAMEQLKNSEADYKAKVDALGRASADTWDAAKQNVIAAWERLDAAYKKAQAERKAATDKKSEPGTQ